MTLSMLLGIFVFFCPKKIHMPSIEEFLLMFLTDRSSSCKNVSILLTALKLQIKYGIHIANGFE